MRWLGCLLLAFAASAETRRALVVGIDEYQPPPGEKAAGIEPSANSSSLVPSRAPRLRNSFRNLEGAAADAREMRQLLIDRYGFEPANIKLLLNRDATRAAILANLEAVLAPREAKPGDVALFFYAGHGSQVLNSKSAEADRLDESIVPADAYNGTRDIRDKEIAAGLNRLLDRGLVVTFVADSCHSGSIGRGHGAARSRALEYDPRDVAEAAQPGAAPAARGALILSATRPDQEAREVSGHGVFTAALLEVLRQSPPDAPVNEVFQQVRSKMQANAAGQEPSLEGVRRAPLTLLGSKASAGPAAGIMTVRGPAAGGRILLEGGLAASLNPGCELTLRGGKSILRISRAVSLTQAEAEVAAGAPAEFARGAIVELTRWMVPPAEALRLYVPRDPPSRAVLEQAAESIRSLAPRVTLIEDPLAAATHTLAWQSGWVLTQSGGASAPVQLAGLRSALPEGARLHVRMPPSAGFAAALRKSLGDFAAVVESLDQNPHYVLEGRPQLDYAWVLANASAENSGALALPPVTNWESEAAKLAAYAARIQKARSWLGLAAPPSGPFPYHLELVDGNQHKTGGLLRKGEKYRLFLRAAAADLEDIAERHVYVFAMDRDANTTLLYPSGNTDSNRLPAGSPAPEAIDLGVDITVTDPLGVDTYIVISTEKPLPDPSVLEGEGVRRGSGDAFESLLLSLGSPRARGPAPAPARWSVSRTQFQTVAR